MILTENKLLVENRKIVIFGAGKIGRSFIGQLFGCSGYKVVFIDVDPFIVSMINSRGNYRVVIKGETEEEIVVPDVKAISATDKTLVADTVSTAGIIAISVGKNALDKVIPFIAAGIEKRYQTDNETTLDIILAENMRSAAAFTMDMLKKNLPENFPVEKVVGLIETSIGKMVPIIPLAELEKDPLVVFAEPYNTLILDAKGFKSAIPDVNGLAPKKNIKAWVDRKAFIHNLGHASAAYYGYFHHPDAVYLYEVLEDKRILKFTRDVMLQSAAILRKVYPEDFTMPDLEDHIDDLLYRFRNKALQDTIFRVGLDLPRKLGTDDRFMGSIHLAETYKMPYNLIINAMTYGFFFSARDEEGKPLPADIDFLESLSEDFEYALINILLLDPVADSLVINELKEQYVLINNNKQA